MKRLIVLFVILIQLSFGMAFGSPETKVIRLEPGVKKVIVIPNEYEFTEERAEFNQFQARYTTFWTIFYLITFIMPYAW